MKHLIKNISTINIPESRYILQASTDAHTEKSRNHIRESYGCQMNLSANKIGVAILHKEDFDTTLYGRQQERGKK